MGSARSGWRGHRCRAVADKRADDRPFCRFFPDLVWVEVSTDGAVEAYLVALQLALGHSNCADPTPIQLLKDDSRHEIAKSVCEWVK